MNDNIMIMIFGIILGGSIVFFFIFDIIKSFKFEHKREEELKKRKENETKEAEEKEKIEMEKAKKNLEIRDRLVEYEFKPVSEWRTELKVIIVELLK